MTARRVLRNLAHHLGLHQRQSTYTIAPRCDWCGHRSRRQRRVAAENVRRIDQESAR